MDKSLSISIWSHHSQRVGASHLTNWHKKYSNRNLKYLTFKNDDLELDDFPQSVRPMELDVDILKQLIEEHPRLTLRYLAEKLECSRTTMEKYLNELVKT